MKSKRTRFGRCLYLALSLFAVIYAVFLSPVCAIRSLAAEVVKGDNIPYNRYLPGATYSTHVYTVDGKYAYCIESEKQAVPSGSYGGGRTMSYSNVPMLVLALHYGPGGDGAWQMKNFFRERYGIELSDEQQYLYTHIVANYAYVGANMSSTPGQFYKGLSAEIAEAAGINEWIRFLGRVLDGSADYSGKKISTGYITAFDTSTQTIAVIGSVEYRSDTPTPPVEEKENVGKLTVTKTGESLTDYKDGSFIYEEKGLQGAKFSVTAREDIVSKGETVFAKDAVVGSFETGADGVGSLENLYPGEYLLTEDEAPFGYRKTAEPVEFTLAKNGTDVSLMTKEIPITNERRKAVWNLSKTDSESGSPLSGAKYGLYPTQDIQTYDGTVLVTAGTLLKEAVSGADGKVDFAMDLPVGSYEIKEINAPFGYVLSTEQLSVSFPADSESDVNVRHAFSDRKVTGKLVLHKEGESLTGYEEGQFIYEVRSLEGAEFDLYAADGEEPTAHLITDEEGNVSADNLPLGEYRLVETKAPYGMVCAKDPIDFKVEYVNQTTPVVVKEVSVLNERERIILNIAKKDSASGAKLSGGTFELYTKEDIVNAKGEVIVEADTLLESTSAKDGEIVFESDLPHGEYYVKETGSIPGYQKNNQIYDIHASYESVPEEGISLTITNAKVPEDKPAPAPETPTKVLGASKNNYVTEDEGKGGYPVLIRAPKEEESIPESRQETKQAGFSIAYGSLLVLTGAGLFIGRKVKEKKAKEKQ